MWYLLHTFCLFLLHVIAFWAVHETGFLEQAWASPTLIATMAARSQNLYHLPRVCHILVPEICVCHKMLCVLVYLSMCSCTWLTGDQRRQMSECTDTWYKWIQYTEIVELLLPGNLPMRLCESETTNGLTVLLFCDIYIYWHGRSAKLTTVPVCHFWMHSHTETSLALLAM